MVRNYALLTALILVSACASSPSPAPAPEVNWQGNWPAYEAVLAGPNTIRVINSNEFAIRVGLRSGRLGRDLVIAAGDTVEIGAPDGSYEVFLQYATDPAGIYKAAPFTLMGHGYEIDVVPASAGGPKIPRIN